MKELYFILFALLLLLSCRNNGNGFRLYQKIDLQVQKIEGFSEEICSNSKTTKRYGDAIVYATPDNRIILFSTQNSNELCLSKNGVGPDEILNPRSIKVAAKKIWVNSYMDANLAMMTLGDQRPRIDKIPVNMNMDDFIIQDKEHVVLSNPYWEDRLLKILNLRTRQVEKGFARREYTPIMMRFNVNTVSLARDVTSLYVCQSISPIVKKYNPQRGFELTESFNLQPDFYRALPERYNLEKYDPRNAHRDWMKQWTPLVNVFACQDWVLVHFKIGYEPRNYYCYFKSGDPKRICYYSEEVSFEIYDFIMNGETPIFYAFDNTSEKSKWLILSI
jgi:hypothetical protein